MALGLLWAVDTQLPLAGIWLLGLVIVTVGMGHGALDALLLLVQFRPLSRAMLMGVIAFFSYRADCSTTYVSVAFWRGLPPSGPLQDRCGRCQRHGARFAAT